MAVNDSRSMNADFAQGRVDSTCIELTPNRGNVENPPLERQTWPRYQNVERWQEDPFLEGHVRRIYNPKERKTSTGSDLRY